MLKKSINSAISISFHAGAVLTMNDFQEIRDRHILVPAGPQEMDPFQHIRLSFSDSVCNCKAKYLKNKCEDGDTAL